MPYRDVIKVDNPYFYMPMNGGSPSVNDGSQSLTVASSTISATAAGMAGEGVVFATSTSHIQYNTGSLFPINDGAWSIEMWFKKSNGADSGYLELLNYSDSNNEVVLYGSAGNQKLEVWHRGSGAARQKVLGPTISDTNWHHVVVSSHLNATLVADRKVKMYLDGVEVGTNTNAQAATYGASTNVWIGAYGSGTGNENWQGTIDEIAVYTEPLTAARVQAHYNEGISPTPTLSVYRGWGVPL